MQELYNEFSVNITQERLMTVGSLKTSLDKTCQLELFIADKYKPDLGQPSRALRSRTKQHKRAIKELSNGVTSYCIYAKQSRFRS